MSKKVKNPAAAKQTGPNKELACSLENYQTPVKPQNEEILAQGPEWLELCQKVANGKVDMARRYCRPVRVGNVLANMIHRLRDHSPTVGDEPG